MCVCVYNTRSGYTRVVNLDYQMLMRGRGDCERRLIAYEIKGRPCCAVYITAVLCTTVCVMVEAKMQLTGRFSRKLSRGLITRFACVRVQGLLVAK